jgi:hypothetical protein
MEVMNMTKKAISLAEFDQLPMETKLDILHKDGVHIGKRAVEEQITILYQLYGFYVEVYFREYRKEVSRIVTTENVDILQPYLDQVKIRDLDKNRNSNNG